MTLSAMTMSLVLIGVLAVQSSPAVDPAAALAQAEARWQKAKPVVYEFSVLVECFCGPDMAREPLPFRVTTTRPYERTSTPLQRLRPNWERLYARYNTVELIFDAIRRAIGVGRDRIDVTYDPEFGFPIKANLDPLLMVADEETYVTVTDFRKIEAPK
jgi:hypothetical protein